MNYVHPQDHPLHNAEKHLRKADPLLDRGIERHGGCSLIDRTASHFHVLIHTIIEQQLSVSAARSIAGKLKDRLAVQEFNADDILQLSAQDLRSCGLSSAKVLYIHGIAEAVHSGELSLEQMEQWKDRRVLSELMRYHGIGLWTAEVFLMFSLSRLDVLPLGDLVLRNAIRHFYQLADDADRSVYLNVAEQWRPYRSVASWYLWAMMEA